MDYRGSKSAKDKSIISLLVFVLFAYIILILPLPELYFYELLLSSSNYGRLVIFPLQKNTFDKIKYTPSSTLRSKGSCLSLVCMRNYSTDNSVVPVIKYSNADTQKLQIINENRGKSGVYC